MILKLIELILSDLKTNFPWCCFRQVKDFPAVLETKEELIDVISRLLWLLSVKHASVNYPVSDYGAFTPILPTKIYNDSTVPPGTFSVLNLPNVNISLVSESNKSIDQSTN